MSYWLDDPAGAAPAPSGLPRIGAHTPSYAETMQAGFLKDHVERNVWNYLERKEAEIASELAGSMEGFDLEDPAPAMPGPRRETSHKKTARETARLLDRAGRFAAAHPEKVGDMPVTREQFDARVRERVLEEYGELGAILGMADHFGAETLGALGGGVADPMTILSLPFGAPGRIGIGATMLIEGAAGSLAEAMDLPRQQEMADYLGIEMGSPAVQLAVAGLTSAGIGGAIAGGARFLEYRRTRSAAQGEQASPDESAADHEARVAAAREDLEAAGEPDQKPGTGPDEAGLDMGRFDYGPKGNASPRSNRIGYVFGKLLERGYEPHIAAGLLGNLIQESGAGLNTKAVGDGGAALGMGQWNGPRKRALLAFAQKRGKDPADLDTQIDFLEHEFQTTEAGAWAQIKAAKTWQDATLIASRKFWRPGDPREANRLAYAKSVYEQYAAGSVPAWKKGVISPSQEAGPDIWTSRGYTGQGQVATGAGRRLDVDYEVVDIASLRQATGDLQPRDRSRMNSDAWVAETAARFDPALLMPAPTVDRGTPLVGRDDIIDSGNGRVRVISRVYERHLDRADAYRKAIRQAGFEIPEGVTRPVLVARRKTDLSHSERVALAIEGQDSGVAELTPTERAQTTARELTAEQLDRFDPGQPVAAEGNRDFVRRLLAGLPASRRNALFDGGSGALNVDGRRLVKQAFFARAWDAQDIVSRAVELEEPGDFRSLFQALEDAAPAWAVLRADIEAGRVHPEFDITAEVLGAMRLIVSARDLAARTGTATGALVDEMLDEIDLLSGPVNPLVVALVRKFWTGERAASDRAISGFLKDYANEARQAGKAGGLIEGESLRAMLVRMDAETFGDLPPDLPRLAPEARVDTGPEARVAGGETRGPFGPVLTGFEGDWRGAVAELTRRQTGEAPGALSHPVVDEPITLVWGEAGTRRGNGFGLSKIILRHPEVLDDLQGRLLAATNVLSRSENRIRLTSERDMFVVSLEWKNQSKTWLLTAYEKEENTRAAKRSMERLGASAETSSVSDPPGKHSADGPEIQGGRPVDQPVGQAGPVAGLDTGRQSIRTGGEIPELEDLTEAEITARIQEELSALEADGDLLLPGEGGLRPARDIIEDMAEDVEAAEVIRLCGLNPGNGFSGGSGGGS